MPILMPLQMGGIEAVITGIMDEFNLHKRFKREYFTAIVICVSFLGSLVNCTQVLIPFTFTFDI